MNSVDIEAICAQPDLTLAELQEVRLILQRGLLAQMPLAVISMIASNAMGFEVTFLQSSNFVAGNTTIH